MWLDLSSGTITYKQVNAHMHSPPIHYSHAFDSRDVIICAGADKPGPIANTSLLDDAGMVRPGLVRVKDYSSIHGRAWKQFYNWYGGGPAIVRCKHDIYSAPWKQEGLSLS